VLEVAVVDSRPFQRLRRVRQLGMTHLVYPGAVHTRFSHSLGAVRVAQLLLDTVWGRLSRSSWNFVTAVPV
jgi:HD superfamily phosphohydrolase